jgi:NADP-dependent aldehyde dehydrogenase
MTIQPVLIGGLWRAAGASEVFHAENPATRQTLPDGYPVSRWSDVELALDEAAAAARALRGLGPEPIARFLEIYADKVEDIRDSLIEAAHEETALPKAPRLAEVELPRTTNQLRQAAAACREGSWALPTIDTKLNIRSMYEPIGPVCVFGPNNFPLAFNGISGGDFAAAVAAGNPVIAKANTSHPATSRLLAEAALAAVRVAGLPAATVQMIYRLAHADGERMAADPRVGAIAYTGSRSAGLALKAAADRAGKPIYLELSSVNPVVILPGALAERLDKVADEFAASCLAGTGQFCTNPGLVILLAGDGSGQFTSAVRERFENAPVETLLSAGVHQSLVRSLNTLRAAGAREITREGRAGAGYCHSNTLLTCKGREFLAHSEALQSEAFGNASLFVTAEDVEEAARVIDSLEGNLTGTLYSHSQGQDDAAYATLAPRLRQRVGRLLNDKMPTGVAVTSAMNHGGPYPATGHPGFTAVGVPASLRRFAMLACYDNVRENRLPPSLRSANPTGRTWRLIDGTWTQS